MAMVVTGTEKLFKGNQIGWAIFLVSGCQLFSQEIKLNPVSKLFILFLCYDMKMLHLGYGKSYEKFPSIPVCDISSNFPALFHYTQGMNRQIVTKSETWILNI